MDLIITISDIVSNIPKGENMKKAIALLLPLALLASTVSCAEKKTNSSS